MATLEKTALEIFFPKGVFEWFDITECSADENNVRITLQEKNLPPIREADKNNHVEPQGFTNITITDFPIRGKRALITFRRRYWKIEGQKEYLKRDIHLAFPGTQLEHEFAVFLKEDGGRESGLSEFYRQVSSPPGERI